MMKIIKNALLKSWNVYIKYYHFFAVFMAFLFAFELSIVFTLRNIGTVIFVISIFLWMKITDKKHMATEVFGLGLLILSGLFLWYIWSSLTTGVIWQQQCRQIICMTL